MTVSERAHNIQQNNPRITWKQALAQAYEEIARKQMEEDEKNNMEDLEAWINEIPEQLYSMRGSHGFDFRAANTLIEDILYHAVQEKEKTTQYPYTSVMERIRNGNTIEEENGKKKRVSTPLTEAFINQTVWSSNDTTKFAAFEVYKEAGTGRIRSDYIDDVDKIIRTLGVDISDLPTYAKVRGYFV